MTSAEYAVSTQGAASGAGRRAGRHRRRQVAEAGGAVQGMVRPHRRFARRLLSPGCPGSASRTAEEQAEMFRRARHGARSRTTVRGRRSRSSSPAPSRKIGWRRAERSICRPSATKRNCRWRVTSSRISSPNSSNSAPSLPVMTINFLAGIYLAAIIIWLN